MPRKKPGQNRVLIAAMVPPRLRAAIDRIAAQEDRTRSKVIENALREVVERRAEQQQAA